jgi:two-component sensor histidine kinase
MSTTTTERYEDIRRRKTANLYTVFAIVAIVVSGVYGLFLDPSIYGIIILSTLPVLLFIPYIGRVGKTALAIGILIHVSNFSIVVYNLGYGHSTGTHAFIFPVIAAVSFLNPLPKHRLEFWVHMGITISVHSIIFIADSLLKNKLALADDKYIVLEMINYGLSILVTLVIVLQHNLKTAESNDRLELQLDKNHDTLGKLKGVVKEKEVLLAEVHHRVKNNLAIISGMLNLRRGMGTKEDIDTVLQECSNRVVSMALVHEKLYKSKDLNNILFHEYVEALCHDIHETLIHGNQEIKLTLVLDQLNLNIDRAIPVGLVINEVITNSIKHAFKNVENPEITVELTRNANSVYLLIRDNGVGIDLAKQPNNEDSLGFMLIESLSHQIDGSFEFANDHGTQFMLRFPLS